MKSNSSQILLSAVLLLIMISACGDDFEAKVDERVVPYFDRFAEEAALRGVEFDNDKARIEASLTSSLSTPTGGVLGLCNQPSVRNPIANIELNIEFWENATDLEKEYLIFHELGHCFLDRLHPMPPPVDGQGNCLSMMAAGSAGCNGIEIYNEDNRAALIDELFSN